MKKAIVTLALVMLCCMLVFTACASQTPAPSQSAAESSAAAPSSAAASSAAAPSSAAASSAAASSAPAAKTYKVAFCGPDAATPSVAFMYKMFVKHAPEFNMEVTFFDGKADPATQAQEIKDCITQGYDSIIIAPNDPNGVVPAVMEAKNAKIAVSLFASDLPAESQQYRDFYVGADDEAGGVAAAQAFMKQFPNGANIVEIGGQSGHGATIKRHDGFTKTIEGSNIKVLASQDCSKWDANDAMNIMQDFIVKYGDKIQGVFCHWDGGLSGCIKAMTAANMDPTKLFSVGIDGNKDGFNNVKEGTCAVSIMQNFDTMTQSALKLTSQVLQGQKVDSINMAKWDLITKDTINSLTAPEW